MKHSLEFLEDLGLSPIEALAYKTAISLGAFPASILAARISVPRSTARYTCESLVKKGLMLETKKANTKLFVAENPTKLFSILNSEEELLKRKREQLEVAVRELQHEYNPGARIPKVMFYEGIDGVERLFDELIKTPSDVFSLSAGDYFLQKDPEFTKAFRAKAYKKYKNIHILRSPEHRNLHKDTPAGIKNRYFSHIDELKIDFQITGDCLSIVSLEGATPMGIMIKHEAIIHAFRQIFMELWENSEE